MDVSADVYKKLFEFLCEAIARRAYPNKTPSLKEISNATIEIGGKMKNISEEIFKSPFKYFIDRRTEANKGSVVSIKDFRLVRILEFIEAVPEKNWYVGDEWQVAGELLLTRFENKNFPAKLSKDQPEFSDEQIEDIFLNVITENRKVFESKKMIALAIKFFEKVTDCDGQIDAWNMITPALQKNSLWNGDFNYFRGMFDYIDTIDLNPFEFENFVYRFESIEFSLQFSCTLSSFSPDRIKAFMEDLNDLQFSREKENQKYQNLKLSWIRDFVNLSELTTREIEDPFFQIFLYFLWLKEAEERKNKYYWPPGPNCNLSQQKCFKVNLVFTLYLGRWLIDKMDFENMIYTKNPDSFEF